MLPSDTFQKSSFSRHENILTINRNSSDYMVIFGCWKQTLIKRGRGQLMSCREQSSTWQKAGLIYLSHIQQLGPWVKASSLQKLIKTLVVRMWAAPLKLEPGENLSVMRSMEVLALTLVGTMFYMYSSKGFSTRFHSFPPPAARMDHSSFTCWTLKWCRKHNWAGRSSPEESWGYSYVSAAPKGKEKTT